MKSAWRRRNGAITRSAWCSVGKIRIRKEVPYGQRREERYQKRSGEQRGETGEEQSSRQVEANPSGKSAGV